MALALAEAGARVVAVDLIPENLARVEREAASLAMSGALAGIAADIRNAQDCRRAIDAAHERFGGLDILVNNAGLLPSYAYPGRFLDGAAPARFWTLDDDVVQNVIDTNYIAHDRMTRYAVPHMIAKGWGRIITLGGTTLELNYVGRNHSDNSLVMRLPKEKIVFVVDFIPVRGVFWRNMPDSWIGEWETSIKRVLAMDWDKLIPGHPGPGGRLGPSRMPRPCSNTCPTSPPR